MTRRSGHGASTVAQLRSQRSRGLITDADYRGRLRQLDLAPSTWLAALYGPAKATDLTAATR